MKKGLIIVAIVTALIGTGLGGLSAVKYASGNKEFVADGFILEPSSEVNVTGDVNQQYYFNQGGRYREKYGTNILFKDTQGTDVNIPNSQFVHYADGSLGAFTKGVIMDVTEIDDEKFAYYNLTKNTILVHNGTAYDIASRGETMKLEEFVWKISDTDYLFASPEVTLKLNAQTSITLPDYAQIKYVDNGIVRIIHQQGTYQTISAETTLISKDGAELNLVGKQFYVNGEPALSLDQMSMNDESYIALDENSDSPELKIPTFQVINGQNGAPGESGADGEDGEMGEDGEDGDDGDPGAVGSTGQIGETGSDGDNGGGGAAGGSGDNGVRGNAGEDGNAGDNGGVGYDGLPGSNGKDAETAASQTGVIGVVQNLRPTVVLDSNSFEVTSSGVQMQLHLMDESNALVQGETKVTIYERATMKQIVSVDAWGSSLESGSDSLISASSLSPDTEYILIVSGQYTTTPDDLEGKEANLFTKIFKTDSLGVKLEKKSVTSDEIILQTTSTNSDVNYSVEVYYYDEAGQKVSVGTYSNQNGSKSELVFDGTSPIGCLAIDANKKYYAALTNVTVNGIMVPSSTTEIEFETLKEIPYGLLEVSPQNYNKLDLDTVKPTILPNEKGKTMAVDIPEIVDPNNGIVKYKYQLFRTDRYQDALLNDSLSNLQPNYEEVTNAQKTCIFSLSGDDIDPSKQFVARVVVVFNDNEIEKEYTTNISDPASLSRTEFPSAVFVPQIGETTISPRADRVAGSVRISDVSSMLVINGSYPLTFTLTSEYDTYTWTADSYVSYSDYTYVVNFDQENLRKKTIYTLSVTGMVDANKDGQYDSSEKNTLLGSTRVQTKDYQTVTAVYKPASVTGRAFAIQFGFAAGVKDEAVSTYDTEYRQYGIQALESVSFDLIQTTNGVEKVMASTSVKDLLSDDMSHHVSDFYNEGWFSAQSQVVKPVSGSGMRDGYTSTQPLVTSRLILTPTSFGFNDSMFQGGEFTIRARDLVDYTSFNTIGFMDDDGKLRDSITFTVADQHIKQNPFEQVTVYDRYNKSSGFNDRNLDDETVVGWEIEGAYANSDVNEVFYSIYEVPSDKSIPVDKDYVLDTANITAELGTPIGEIHADYNMAGVTNQSPIATTKIFFDNPGAPVDGAYTVVEDHDTTTGITTTFKYLTANPITRGKRYIITYKVRSSYAGSSIDCDNDQTNDLYPDCMYTKDPVTPLYRSAIIATKKQTPSVQRYLYSTDVTSANKKATYKYKIVDPDKAIVGPSGEPDKLTITVKEYSVVDGTSLSEKPINNSGKGKKTDFVRPVRSAVAPYDYSFETFEFTMDNNNVYYVMELEYIDVETTDAVTSKILSKPMYFGTATTIPGGADTRIPIQALGRTYVAANGFPADSADPSYEKTIVNMGGYQYRITLRGQDLAKFVAFKVTVKKDANNYVEYYPVYPEVISDSFIQDGSTYYPYGYLYIDAEPLADYKTAVTTVSIQGYYGTGNMGYSYYDAETPVAFVTTTGLSATFVDNPAYDESNPAAGVSPTIEKYASVPSNEFIHNANDGEKVVKGNGTLGLASANASGVVTITNPIKILSGSHYTKTLAGDITTINKIGYKYNFKPTVTKWVDGTPAAPIEYRYDIAETDKINIDETGVKSDTTVFGDYTDMMQLSVATDVNFTHSSENQLQISNVMPAVSYDVTSLISTPGAQSFGMEFCLPGATPTVPIYAEVFEKVGSEYKLLNVSKNVTTDGGTVHHLVADKTEGTRYVDAGYYTETVCTTPDANGETLKIPITHDVVDYRYPGNKVNKLRLYVQGLKLATEYRVKLFAYDENHNKIYLYDQDYEQIERQYASTTKSYVTISVLQEAYTYKNYAEKWANFGFSMNGDEGTGLKVLYQVVDKDGTPADDKWLPYDSGLGYYSSSTTQNAKLTVNATPGTGPIHVFDSGYQGKYELCVKVLTMENENMLAAAEGFQRFTFDAPTTLQTPGVYLNAYEDKEGGSTVVSVSYYVVDYQAAIMGPGGLSNYATDAITFTLYDLTDTSKSFAPIKVNLGGNFNGEVGGVLTQDHFYFNGVTTGHNYKVELTAGLDKNNDGVNDGTLKIERFVQLTGNASCGVSASADPVIGDVSNNMVLTFSDPKNFENVEKALITVFSSTGAQQKTTTIDLTSGMFTSKVYQYTWNWNIKKAGNYTVQIQYQKTDGTKLGDISVPVVVR